jgi:hypothetical protein
MADIALAGRGFCRGVALGLPVREDKRKIREEDKGTRLVPVGRFGKIRGRDSFLSGVSAITR